MKRLLLLTCMASCNLVMAETTDVTQCVMQQFSKGEDSLTLKEIRQLCAEKQNVASVSAIEDGNKTESDMARQTQQPTSLPSLGMISERVIAESETEFDPYVLTPHRVNYIMPAYTTNSINTDAYSHIEGYEENLQNIETKFQLSVKVPLNQESLFIEGDGLYFGFTMQAWWQVWADNISKPFRETNYQPELFYLAPLDWHPFGGNTGFIVGFEHQSNGQNQALSRSWNRVYGHFLYEKDRFALSFRPWYRLNEEPKAFEFDPDGDDNPDIEDFMGHFELGMVYKWEQMELGFMGRRNFSTDNGSAELNLTFPLWGKLRGYATAFNGYGESLIDYNHKQTRLGIGISLNDIL